MATLIRTNGLDLVIKPANKKFTLEELQGYVGGYVQAMVLNGNKEYLGKHMLMNEDGLAMNLAENAKASVIAGRKIVGDVLIVSKSEF